MNNKPKNRIVYIEVIRITACLFIIFNHTNEWGYWKFSFYTPGSFRFYFHLYLSTLCKCAIPLFLMISGAVLLPKEEPISKTLKRIIKPFSAAVVFNFLYFLSSQSTGYQISFPQIIWDVLYNGQFHLWYLYLYIAFLITLPFLRKMVRGLDVKTSLYMLGLAVFIAGLQPTLELYHIPFNGYLYPAWIIDHIFMFPLAGYVIHHLISSENVRLKHLIILYVLDIICLIIGFITEKDCIIQDGGVFINEIFLNNFKLLHSFVFFLTLKVVFSRMHLGDRIMNIIGQIGACTYGIYLMHIWFLHTIRPLNHIWEQIVQTFFLGSTAGVLLVCVGVFSICGILTYLLRKIPGIRWFF